MKINKNTILILAAVGVGYYLYTRKPKQATPVATDDGGGGGIGGGGFGIMPVIKTEPTPAPPPAKVPFVCPTHPDPRKQYICSGTRIVGETMKTGNSLPSGVNIGYGSAPSQTVDKEKFATIRSGPTLQSGGLSGGVTQAGAGPSSSSVFFSGKQPLTIDNLLM